MAFDSMKMQTDQNYTKHFKLSQCQWLECEKVATIKETFTYVSKAV